MDEISLRWPKLTINSNLIETEKFIKFLGVPLDENLNRNEHIKYTENKIAKNLGQLCKPEFFRPEYPTSNLIFVFTYLHR